MAGDGMNDDVGRRHFLALIDAEMDRYDPLTEAMARRAFAAGVMNTVDFEDIRDRRPADVAAMIGHAWRYLQVFDHRAPKLAVFNPQREEHGWTSQHTVVLLLADGIPFLAESLRNELNRRELAVHMQIGSDLDAERDADHVLQRVVAATGATDAHRRREALVYMEVTRVGERAARSALEQALGEVLADVACVVADFEAMRRQVAELAGCLPQLPGTTPEEEWRETVVFLNWLLDGNFTFLGHAAFDAAPNGEAQPAVLHESSRLGLVRAGVASDARILEQELHENAAAVAALGEQVSFSKSITRSRVHRPVYPDCVIINCRDATGRIRRQHCFLGLFTAAVHTMDPEAIPIVRRKVADVIVRSDPGASSHRTRTLRRILELLPRDELFQSDGERLFRTAMRIFHIQERRKTRLFVRVGPRGRFASCLVYLPRDIYCTDVRRRIEAALMQALGAEESDFTTFFSESVLVTTHFVMRLGQARPAMPDIGELEALIAGLCEQWHDRLRQALFAAHGEEEGARRMRMWSVAFPAAYRDENDAASAVTDMRELERLDGDAMPGAMLYRTSRNGAGALHFRLYSPGRAMALSDVIPMLENLGMHVLGERPYRLVRADGHESWVYDFTVSHALPGDFDVATIAPAVRACFLAVHSGQAENDGFNRLVIGTGLDWREIAVLRAYAQYMKQIRYTFAPQFVAEALGRHLPVAQALVELYRTRFDPAIDGAARTEAEDAIVERIVAALDGVEQLNDDQALRACLALIRATLRTNWFCRNADGRPYAYFSFKLDCARIPHLPRPLPMFEIWVYSPRTEGVHLRYGPVARGGLRWSDRLEDFRTEVLGLVKAQQVKNAVIVPAGAKGGFVAKQLPANAARDAIQAEGVACYRMFIQGMLDLTDNVVGGDVVPPAGVVCHDAPDPYLVVAADKGTAGFSDIANEISDRYGFWLRDAFASGGSVGYNHKTMAITARGAWVAVQRHFRERGTDVQNDPLTVVGIGDMSGDVFGNGMLRSRSIRLVAAFDHRHVFIDPDPDPEAAFAERERLFALPRSSWADYDQTRISSGGGVFARTLKSVPLTPQIQRVLDVAAGHMTPAELVSAVLAAPVDLIFNGGIGTYFKASDEDHAAVGDKANDAVRIDAAKIRARVIGEGGNLGMTQRARVEFCALGGVCNTDFIDNSGGVDCSDHEVNIKILLNRLVALGELTLEQRARVLADMRDDVAALVLANNYRQTQAISIAESEAAVRINEYRALIISLEARGMLDRRLEFLPDDDALQERRQHGRGLLRPELAVLLCYAKRQLKLDILATGLPDDPHLARALRKAFPVRLAEHFDGPLAHHELRREIIATQLANELIDTAGITFVERLQQGTSAGVDEIVAAWVVARDVFDVERWWHAIEAMDHAVEARVQLEAFIDLQRLLRLATRWFIHNRPEARGVDTAIASRTALVARIQAMMGTHLRGEQLEAWRKRHEDLRRLGFPQELAVALAGSSMLIGALGIVDVALTRGLAVERVAQIAFALNERLDFYRFGKQITALPVDNRWQAMARESYLDELDWQLRAIVGTVVSRGCEDEDIDACIDRWESERVASVAHWRALIGQVRDARPQGYAMYAVAVRGLLALAQPRAD